jgi:putative hydrolase of the HAD superfamily
MDKKWIWFDLDDTLHDYTYVGGQARSAILGFISQKARLPIEIVEQDYRKVFLAHNKLEYIDGRSSKDYRSERFAAAVASSLLGLQERQKVIDEALVLYEAVYMDNLRLKPGAVELIRLLMDKGFGLAILTDAPHDTQMRVLHKLGLLPLFDDVFTAGDLRVSKPNGMMTIVLDRLQVAPENVIMIGDSLERDVWPARDAGIKPIWFNEKKLINEQGFLEVAGLAQIPKLIGL